MNRTTDPDPEVGATPLGVPPTLASPARPRAHHGPPAGSGPAIAAFSPEDLENLVEYWLREKVEGHYAEVVRFAGPGDKGCDVVGYVNPGRVGDWDNYQCKHFADSCRPPGQP